MKRTLGLDGELFREKVLRDLLSIIHDPLIILEPNAIALQSRMQEAVQRFNDAHVDRLLRMIAPPDPRLPLGKWFERVFLLALRITFPFADVFHSVTDGQGGELDFVIRDGRRLMHIECSIKFFLFQNHVGIGLNAFIGPGGQDRLDLKLAKMRDVQLARQIPSSMASELPVERVLWMGGRLHFPLGTGESWRPRENELNPTCVTGFWASSREILSSLTLGNRLIIVPRQWWVTSLHGMATELLAQFDAVDIASSMSEPIMVAEVSSQDGTVQEVRRGFIVPGDGKSPQLA